MTKLHVGHWLADLLLRRHRVSTQPSNVLQFPVGVEPCDGEAAPAVPFPTGEPGHVYDRNDPRLGHGVDTEPTAQHEVYLILTPEERAKRFVRPVRRSYQHVAGPRPCGTVTTMSLPLAETYAAKPAFYGSTYCTGCGMHLPVQQFVWDKDRTMVGT